MGCAEPSGAVPSRAPSSAAPARLQDPRDPPVFPRGALGRPEGVLPVQVPEAKWGGAELLPANSPVPGRTSNKEHFPL